MRVCKSLSEYKTIKGQDSESKCEKVSMKEWV